MLKRVETLDIDQESSGNIEVHRSEKRLLQLGRFKADGNDR